MARGIRGESVVLITRKASLDEFNHPTWVESRETVDNVLIGEPVQAELTNSADMRHARAAYTLGIPKGDSHDWQDVVVEFWGKRWRQFGQIIRGMEHQIPLDWNQKVTVEEVL